MPPFLLLSTNRSHLEATWNNRSAVSNSGCKTELSKTACVRVSCTLDPLNQKLWRWEQDDSDEQTVRTTLHLIFATGLSLFFFNWEHLLGLWCSKPLSTLISCSLEIVCFSFHCPNSQNFLYSLSFFAGKLANSFLSSSLSCNTLPIRVNTHSDLFQRLT